MRPDGTRSLGQLPEVPDDPLEPVPELPFMFGQLWFVPDGCEPDGVVVDVPDEEDEDDEDEELPPEVPEELVVVGDADRTV